MKVPVKQREIEKPGATRGRILRAAIREFSVNGLAGARTDAIAKAAKVNKALLYYYYQSKDGLYIAALREASARVRENAQSILEAECSAGEKVLRSALNHFDRIVSQRDFQSLLQREMAYGARNESDAMRTIVETIFQPMLVRMKQIIEDGIRSDELCDIDWFQIWCAAFGGNVFYFLTSTKVKMALPFDPLSASAIEFRREAIVYFLGQALFVDRRRGRRLAKRILADTPVPKIGKFPVERRKL